MPRKLSPSGVMLQNELRVALNPEWAARRIETLTRIFDIVYDEVEYVGCECDEPGDDDCLFCRLATILGMR